MAQRNQVSCSPMDNQVKAVRKECCWNTGDTTPVINRRRLLAILQILSMSLSPGCPRFCLLVEQPGRHPAITISETGTCVVIAYIIGNAGFYREKGDLTLIR